MAGIRIEGNVSGNVAEVAGTNQLKIIPEVDSLGNPKNIGNVRIQSVNDEGALTGNPYLLSPETDDDYRLRVSQDTILDDELFNYTSQNTGKHTIIATAVNLVPSWTAGGYNTNPTGVTTSASGATLQTYACFPIIGTGTISCDMELAFTAQPTSNTIIDFGLFYGATTNPFAPSDGAYFRLNASGLQGILNYNGTETSTGIFPLAAGAGTWAYTNNKKYQFILYISSVEVEFWVNDGNGAKLLSDIAIPSGQGTAISSATAPFHIRHAIVGGAAGTALSATLSKYNVRLGGVTGGGSYREEGNRCFGSYQGLSGGAAMGQLIAGTVTSGTLVKPTAAVPANGALTANLPNSLGGRIYETLSTGLAANVDGIFASYQIPGGTVGVQGRRLVVTGIKLSGMVQTVVAGGPSYTEWYIAFGHTAAALTTAEAATTKAPRRVMLPELTSITVATAAAGTLLQQPAYVSNFDQPIYVNPGEFIALVGNKTITTALTSGVLAYTYQFIYTWE